MTIQITLQAVSSVRTALKQKKKTKRLVVHPAVRLQTVPHKMSVGHTSVTVTSTEQTIVRQGVRHFLVTVFHKSRSCYKQITKS